MTDPNYTKEDLLQLFANHRIWLERCRRTVVMMEEEICFHMGSINYIKQYALKHGIDLSEADKQPEPVETINPYRDTP